MYSARDGNVECTRLLLEAGADKDIVDCNQLTALYYTALKERTQCMRLLLEDVCETDANRNVRCSMHRCILCKSSIFDWFHF